MSILYTCRRTMISALGIVCVTVLGLYLKTDTSWAIAGIAGALTAGNSFQASMKAKHTKT